MAKLLWTQKQDMGPQPRIGHALAYDGARASVVLFGGRSGGAGDLGDTWAWDGSHWTQVADLGPGPRSEHAMTYDVTHQVIVLFGGRGTDVILGDTWAWDGEDWTQVADTGPSARSGHAMAYDGTRDRVVLFSGAPAAGEPAGDTWEWDGQEWTQHEDVGPPARRDHVLAFDSVHGRVVLFGGADAPGNALGDTWEWNGNVWTQVAEFGPDPCVDAAMVFKNARIALYGGAPSFGQGQPQAALRLTWEWDGKHWTARQDIGPGPRAGHAMAFDTARCRVVLFGGSSTPLNRADGAAQPLGDTWEHLDGPAAPPADQPVSVQSLHIDPASTSMRTPVPITVTVTLTGDAPPSGLPILLEVAGDSVLGFSPLPSLVVPAGARMATTVLPGTLVTSRVDFSPMFRLRDDVLIRATAGGATASATLTLSFP
jgi:galactose oxidase-like protein